MKAVNIIPIPLAVRVYPDPPEKKRRGLNTDKWVRPESMLIFDTETTVDATQRLLFGCYRFVDQGVCREEGFFHGDDLSKKEVEILRQYVAKHKADAVGRADLTLISRREFLKKLYAAVYKGRCLLVGFNLPFDLARLGFSVAVAS